MRLADPKRNSQNNNTCAKNGLTYRERSGYRVETDMDFMYKVCGIADAHQGASRVDVILPTIELLVALE